MKRNLGFFFAIAILLMMTAPTFAQDDGAQTLTIDDVSREYYVHVPDSYDETTPMPLMLALHGGGGSGREFSAFSGLSTIADEGNFITVYPTALDGRWNFLSRENREDDVDFLTALIDEITATYTIDAERVYVTGYSNGGLMALRLRCSFSDRFAGVVAVGATMTFILAEQCLQATPVPTLIVWGTSDGAFPWEGYAQAGTDEVISTMSSSQTQTFFASLNQCSLQLDSFDDVSADTSENTVFRQRFDTCNGGAVFHLIGIAEWDNRWPNATILLNTDAGVQNIRGAIWDFLSQHTLITE